MKKILKYIIIKHWALILLIMCVSVFILTMSSYNLFFLLTANIKFISEHGLFALSEGGLMQFVELAGLMIISAVFYIIFKSCERVLVDKLMD